MDPERPSAPAGQKDSGFFLSSPDEGWLGRGLGV